MNDKKHLDTTLEGVGTNVGIDEDEEQRRARLMGEGKADEVQEVAASKEEPDRPAFTVRRDGEEKGRLAQLQCALKHLGEKASALATKLKDKATVALSDLKDKVSHALHQEPKAEEK